jgi:unspecific monooxygenase
MIILIAGHENPQLFFTSILYTLAKYPEIQSRLRDELPTVKNLEGSALLNTFLFETLRLLPPLGQIINRRTTRNVILGSDIYIPKGAYVGYNNFVTGRDSSSWGEDSEEFKPERWGSTNDEVLQNYKRFKSTSQLSSFHGGRRACLGERFALFESRMFVKCIVENFKVNLSAGWKDKLTPAGPICPFLLRCDFERITKNSAPKH